MKISSTQILALGAVALAGFVVVRASRAAAELAQAVNPLNNNNSISQGFNELIGAGDRDSSIGSDLFDFIERLKGRDPFDPNTAPPKIQPIQGPLQ